MLFVDLAQIHVKAGAGGNGCSAMFQEPYTRHPRPTGGDGGDGGSVFLIADPHVTTLLDFTFQKTFRAERGRHGSGNNRTGKRGEDCLVRTPVGTIVSDAKTQAILRDLATPGQQLLVAKGGAGGLGNARVKRATPGRPAEERRLRLELKLIADVRLIGCPNAGKSSLLARLSTARPKIAPYPFTTRTPVLGVASAGVGQSFVVCDIPGLIEGAHEGRGLGMQFLRHIERTRLLIHVVDLAGVDGRDPIRDYHQLNRELVSYHAGLVDRPQIIVANKMDLPEARERLASFQAAVPQTVVPISCATMEGIPALITTIWQRLQLVRSSAEVPTA